jgi:hypothetical protein
MLAVIHGKYCNPIKNKTSNHSHNSTTNPLLNTTTHTPAQLINITLPRPPTIHHITHHYHRSSPKYHRTLFRYQYVTPRSTRSTIQGQTKIWHSPQKVFHEKDEEFCGADPFATKPKIKQPQSTSLFPVFVRNSTVNPGKGSLATLLSWPQVRLRAFPHEDYSQENSKVRRLHLSSRKPEPNPQAHCNTSTRQLALYSLIRLAVSLQLK